uniref:DNA-directed RNA polymerase subunit alpha n=1 Tax=Panagrolaimus sp. JU765 TaxID=591449 RepID=A0AC34RHH1_9BILA
MNFKEGFSYISKDELDFHTPNSKIMMKKICGMMNATVNFLSKNGKNSTLITVPLQDPKFRFFVYVGNNTNSNYSLPTLDLQFLTENLKTVENLTVENLVLPKINKIHVTDLSAVVYGYNFPTFSPCIYLEKIIHATHFTLDYDGINVAKKDKVDEAEIKGQIIEIDRPFYYGVWFNDNIDQ